MCCVMLQSVHLLSTDMVTAVWRPALHDTLETTHPGTVTLKLVSDITGLSVHDCHLISTMWILGCSLSMCSEPPV